MVLSNPNVDEKHHSGDVNIMHENATKVGTSLHPRHPSLPPMQHLLYTNEEAQSAHICKGGRHHHLPVVFENDPVIISYAWQHEVQLFRDLEGELPS